eukprot:TRINITY_DN83036_c0_g1_i1.p1 TRINITY_DN83036_c0_g1~~TRINITY_DN83036_c0_g1_i1.p1  ORF type:complete len:762 (-),score=139.38 TRINITY_DN83036_c0_g1_i1:160-2445(-)
MVAQAKLPVREGPALVVHLECAELGVKATVTLPAATGHDASNKGKRVAFPKLVGALSSAGFFGDCYDLTQQQFELQRFEDRLQTLASNWKDRHAFYSQVETRFSEMIETMTRMKRDYYREIDHLREQLSRQQRDPSHEYDPDVIFFDAGSYKLPSWKEILEELDNLRMQRELLREEISEGRNRRVPLHMLCPRCRSKFQSPDEAAKALQGLVSDQEVQTDCCWRDDAAVDAEDVPAEGSTPAASLGAESVKPMHRRSQAPRLNSPLSDLGATKSGHEHESVSPHMAADVNAGSRPGSVTSQSRSGGSPLQSSSKHAGRSSSGAVGRSPSSALQSPDARRAVDAAAEHEKDYDTEQGSHQAVEQVEESPTGSAAHLQTTLPAGHQDQGRRASDKQGSEVAKAEEAGAAADASCAGLEDAQPVAKKKRPLTEEELRERAELMATRLGNIFSKDPRNRKRRALKMWRQKVMTPKQLAAARLARQLEAFRRHLERQALGRLKQALQASYKLGGSVQSVHPSQSPASPPARLGKSAVADRIVAGDRSASQFSTAGDDRPSTGDLSLSQRRVTPSRQVDTQAGQPSRRGGLPLGGQSRADRTMTVKATLEASLRRSSSGLAFGSGAPRAQSGPPCESGGSSLAGRSAWAQAAGIPRTPPRTPGVSARQSPERPEGEYRSATNCRQLAASMSTEVAAGGGRGTGLPKPMPQSAPMEDIDFGVNGRRVSLGAKQRSAMLASSTTGNGGERSSGGLSQSTSLPRLLPLRG